MIGVGCGMLPYIEDGNDAIVNPGGGVWICAAILRPPITLTPGEEITRTFQVNGGAASASGGSTLCLRPGRYTLHVEFWGGHPDLREEVRLRSPNVSFEVGG